MKILVYCFFGKHNIGDNLFVEAYKNLFPEHEFTFTSQFNDLKLIKDSDIIFVGGGSFLDNWIPELSTVYEYLKNKTILYLGVGTETSIHSDHEKLLKISKLIYTRSENYLEKIRKINPNVYYCPDLVYSLSDKINKSLDKKPKSILFVPNAYTISRWNDLAWKHSAWEYFKSEIAQYFMHMIRSGYTIDVLSMCKNKNHIDEFAAVEIQNKIFDKINFIKFEEFDFTAITNIFSQYDLVISQRYHGLVIADIVKVPCINLHHHDKLKNFRGILTDNINYYRCSKEALLTSSDNLFLLNEFNKLKDNSINLNIFRELTAKVNNIIKGN